MNDWERFFELHATSYMENIFPRSTLAEVDFLVEVMGLRPGMAILDMGCGTGRHSLELAKRGYRMTGVDLSGHMLNEARKSASAAGVQIEWVQADATAYQSDARFDAAICLCEGAFGLLGAGEDPAEHDHAILQNLYAALRPGAPVLLTALSALRHIRQFSPEDVAAGKYDPLTLVESGMFEIKGEQIPTRERGYTAPELRLLFRFVGFEVLHTWGGTAGNWGRRPLELDEYEIMVAGRKPA